MQHRWSPEGSPSARSAREQRTPPTRSPGSSSSTARHSRDTWPSHVALLGHGRNSATLADVRVWWSRDRVFSFYKVALPPPGSMDIYLFCGWLEAEVKKQAGVDPFTQIRFTSSKDVLVQACADCVHLPIDATIFAGKRERLEGALDRGKQRAAWVSLLSIQDEAPSKRGADPTIVKVAFGSEKRSLYLKTAPGKNSSTMVAQCAWMALSEPHPNVLPVILTAGANLFLFSRRCMASTNVLHWLRCDTHVVLLSAAARRRLVCSMLLQVFFTYM